MYDGNILWHMIRLHWKYFKYPTSSRWYIIYMVYRKHPKITPNEGCLITTVSQETLLPNFHFLRFSISSHPLPRPDFPLPIAFLVQPTLSILIRYLAFWIFCVFQDFIYFNHHNFHQLFCWVHIFCRHRQRKFLQEEVLAQKYDQLSNYCLF